MNDYWHKVTRDQISLKRSVWTLNVKQNSSTVDISCTISSLDHPLLFWFSFLLVHFTHSRFKSLFISSCHCLGCPGRWGFSAELISDVTCYLPFEKSRLGLLRTIPRIMVKSLKNTGQSLLSLSFLGCLDKDNEGRRFLFNGQIILWASSVPLHWLCNLF